MAILYWSNTDGTGTWNATNFGGSLPVNDDRVIINGANSGNADLLYGLNRTTDTAGAGLNLASLEVTNDYEGDIGSDAAPLTLGAKDVMYRGRGTMHIKGDGGSASCPVRNLLCDSSNLQDAVFFSYSGVAGDTPDVICVTSGHLQYHGAGSTTAGKCNFFCTPSGAGQAFITIDAETACNTVYNSGGQVTSRIDLQAVYQRAGTTIVNAANGGGASVYCHYVFLAGGLFIHNIPIGGSVPVAHITGGIFDMRRSPEAKILTSWHRYYGGTLATDGPNIHAIGGIVDLSGGEVDID